MPNAIQLEIRRPNKDPLRFDLNPGVFTIGREEDCLIRLAHEDVEPRHGLLTVREESYWIEDLDSSKGTFVDGDRVRGCREVKPGQLIGFGPFTLVLLSVSVPAPERQPVTQPPEPVAAAATPLPKPPSLPVPAPLPEPPPAVLPPETPVVAGPPIEVRIEERRSIKQQIHKELLKRLDLKRLAASRVNRDELRQRALQTIQAIVQDVSGRLPPHIPAAVLVKEICDEALGLGPLETYLEDPDITEIMVNGPNQIYIEKAGKLIHTDMTFMDESSVLAIIERIVSPLGRRIDESQPYVDARLPDGSRVNAIIHPLSLVGPCVTIRKFSKTPYTDEDMVRFGTTTHQINEFANVAVKLRKNIVVSGGTGSGKTTLLNVLSGYLPAEDRIVTIEDAAELRLTQTHVVRLESRPPNIEGKGAVTIRDLVRNALRMRPDRIVVGECRGGEALDMLQAMNTGHDGSLTTVHANSPRDVISRLETMVLMSGMDLPVRAIREQIASAIDLIVHESRFSDGTRKVVKVTEIVGQEGEQITMQDIFEYRQTGIDSHGKVVGRFVATGAVPTFVEEIGSRGLSINRQMFDPKQFGS